MAAKVEKFWEKKEYKETNIVSSEIPFITLIMKYFYFGNTAYIYCLIYDRAKKDSDK